MSCWDDVSSGGCTLGGIATIECFVCIFESLLNIAIRVGGILVLVMFLIGGFNYLTAGGDPKKASQAWNTLSFAVLGLVLMIMAWFVMLFISKFTGIDVTIFRIGN